MKTIHPIALAVVVLGVLLVSCPAARAQAGAFGLGGRYHADHSIFEELPYDGDMSYGLCYQWHEGGAYWQVALNYAPEVTGTNEADYVITPQLNLVFSDNAWRAGVGALTSYVEYENGDDDWFDVYWQFLLGLQIPFFGMKVDAQAYYVFEEWNEIEEFEFEDLDYGVWLTFNF
jgi:hypothetical protein